MAAPSTAELQIEELGDITIARFPDPRIADAPAIARIGGQLFRQVDELGCRKLLLNFARVRHISSELLGKLITLHLKLQEARGKLVLCGVDPMVREVFEISRVDKKFAFYPDEESGLGAF